MKLKIEKKNIKKLHYNKPRRTYIVRPVKLFDPLTYLLMIIRHEFIKLNKDLLNFFFFFNSLVTGINHQTTIVKLECVRLLSNVFFFFYEFHLQISVDFYNITVNGR